MQNVPEAICWPTTDPRAAWALSQLVKQPHEPGPYEWDGAKWNLTNLAGTNGGKPRPGQVIARLK
ncbi:hypothetical protein [Actinomadura sp. 6N118]|uniref:hypothetical protein n=1 Tax=Actinomadura sp. 6N118 TaxID=3375151 RepID=UPI003788D413